MAPPTFSPTMITKCFFFNNLLYFLLLTSCIPGERCKYFNKKNLDSVLNKLHSFHKYHNWDSILLSPKWALTDRSKKHLSPYRRHLCPYKRHFSPNKFSQCRNKFIYKGLSKNMQTFDIDFLLITHLIITKFGRCDLAKIFLNFFFWPNLKNERLEKYLNMMPKQLRKFWIYLSGSF